MLIESRLFSGLRSRLLILSGLDDGFGEGVCGGHKFSDVVIVIK
jgi:hypothetical protein